MNKRLQIVSACVRVILLGSLVITMASCGESASSAYNRGYEEGHSSGVAAAKGDTAAAREEGRLVGFKEGYEAARPAAATTAPTGVWRTLSIIVMTLGMAKIVLSLLVLILLLILDNSSDSERLAKMTATSLGAVVVFWLSNTFTVRFSQPLANALLGPAASTSTGKLLTALVAVVATWAGFWAFEGIAKTERRLYICPNWVSLHGISNRVYLGPTLCLNAQCSEH
jgi:hypothetical protein